MRPVQKPPQNSCRMPVTRTRSWFRARVFLLTHSMGIVRVQPDKLDCGLGSKINEAITLHKNTKRFQIVSITKIYSLLLHLGSNMVVLSPAGCPRTPSLFPCQSLFCSLRTKKSFPSGVPTVYLSFRGPKATTSLCMTL